MTATSTLTVSGLTTLGNASTTLLSVSSNLDFATASSTGIVKFSQINSDTGSISFGDDNLSTTGTLTVSGHTTLGNASTTDNVTITASSTTAFNVRDGSDDSIFTVDTSTNSGHNAGVTILSNGIFFHDPDVVNPDWDLDIVSGQYGEITHGNSDRGSLEVVGYSEASDNPLDLQGMWMLSDPNDALAAIRLEGYKWDGSPGGHVTSLGAAETVLHIGSGHDIKVAVMGNGNVGISNSVASPSTFVAPTAMLDVAEDAVFNSWGVAAGDFTVKASGGGTLLFLDTDGVSSLLNGVSTIHVGSASALTVEDASGNDVLKVETDTTPEVVVTGYNPFVPAQSVVNGTIRIGSIAAYSGLISYDGASLGNLTIANTCTSGDCGAANGDIIFLTQTNGTDVEALRLNVDGTVQIHQNATPPACAEANQGSMWYDSDGTEGMCVCVSGTWKGLIYTGSVTPDCT